MISSPTSNKPQFNMIRRTQSTDISDWHPSNSLPPRNDDDIFRRLDNVEPAPNRLDSIFRSRPKLGMSPIGTRKLLPTSSEEIPSIRPCLSCPAAVFESPLRNLLEPQLEGIRDEVLEVSAIDFDDESVILPETNNDENNDGDEGAFPRNLNNAFDLLVKTKPSPTSVLEPTMISLEGITVPLISLPEFTLCPSLTGSLSKGLVSRVSFYSIVRDINAEASNCLATDPAAGREVIAEDGRVHVHPSPEEECKSILVGKCHHFSNALLDEEWFLLSAIASRSKEEIEANLEGLLPTFAEAMGETTKEDGAGGSRTQLWKPGRSWWEAKSGKNPWVEPVVHNNRWRYLWPLIHYHKFIAKCIKKLKRNGIDVKSSTSIVSIFLRQEVCHVSDHLAFMSKYDSEEWTNALRNFDGWTDHDPVVEETVRNLVLCQRLVSDNSDVNSSLLRSQLDQAVLSAMQAVKEEAAKAAASENYDYGKGHSSVHHPGHVQARNEEDCGSQNSFMNGAFHPHGHHIHRSWSGSAGNPQSAIKTKGRGYEGNWREEYPPSYHNQGMYRHQFEHPPPHYGHPYGPTMEPQYYHHYDQYGPPPHHHPPMGYHHGGDMPYHDGQYHGHPPYYNGYYDGSFHEGMMIDNSMHSESYAHPPPMATPNRYHGEHPPYQMSPFHHHHDYWGHLNISQLPGLAPSPSMSMHTPSKPPRGNSNRSFRKRQGNPPIDGKAKSLIIFPKQANSPASRFVMSPQDKSNPYYTARNFQSSALNQSAQEESFVLPTIEDFAHGTPNKAMPNGGVELGMAHVPHKYYDESRNEEGEGQSSE